MDDILWTAKGYREFLATWLAREQERRPSFSIRLMGKRLALDPSLLGKILQGERHLATSRIQPVCDLVGLAGNQAEYFRHLVLHAKSKTAREAQACFERLQELRRIAPLPLADAEYAELVAMLADLRSRALTRSAKVERPTKVVQLNLQLVPVAGYGIRDAAGTV